jgi:two-component system response regulator HydG
MVVLDTDGKLDIDDLPPELDDGTGVMVRGESTSADLAEIPGGASGVSVESLGASVPDLIGKTMDDIERWALEETLKLTAGNREEAAKILDIGARTLYRKLDKYKQEG